MKSWGRQSETESQNVELRQNLSCFADVSAMGGKGNDRERLHSLKKKKRRMKLSPLYVVVK